MTVSKAKELGYTHHGTMFGFIPVYLNIEYDGFEAIGKNKFTDFILQTLIDIDIFLDLGYTWQAWQGEKL